MWTWPWDAYKNIKGTFYYGFSPLTTTGVAIRYWVSREYFIIG